MIRINLLALSETEHAIGRRQQLSLIALGLSVVLLIMIVPYVLQGRKLSRLDGRIEAVQEEISRLNAQATEVRNLDRMKRDLEAKLRIVQDLNEKRVGPARVLADLSAATPGNLWLVDFNEDGGKATLTGMALDNETIARFMRQLQASPYFVGVDLVETSRRNMKKRRGKGRGRGTSGAQMPFTRFIIEATIDYFGRGGKPPEDEAPAAKSEKRETSA